jgi:hypothetical protein
MRRAQTISFWDVYMGLAILIVLENVLDPPPAIVLLGSLAYFGAALLVIGRRRSDHEGEVPPRRHD